MADELYVLNSGQPIPTNDTAPSDKNSYNINTSKNPRLFSTNVTGDTSVSINCYEIHDEDRSSHAAPVVGSSLLNRLFPLNTTVESYTPTLTESAGYEVIIETDTNGDGSSNLTLPTSNDHFIIIYADNLYKHHIGKITSYSQYDGTQYRVEFEPRLKENIAFNTNVSIYQGPATSVTTTVAVGYGLLSDGIAAGTSDKEERHDVYADVTKPTFYFYRELDYNRKYVAVKKSTGFGSTSKSVFKTRHRLARHTSDATDTNDVTYYDKSFYTQNAKLVDNQKRSDELEVNSSNVGRMGVDGHASGSTIGAYTFDITDWNNAIKNYDSRSGTYVSTYISEITSPESNQYMGHSYNTKLNNSITYNGNMVTTSFIDNQRILERKIKDFEKLTVKEIIGKERMNKAPESQLPGLYTRASSTTITVSGLVSGEDITTLLGSSAPFEYLYIDNYYYIPSAITAPVNGEQTITVSDQRLFTAFAFSSAAIPTFTSKNAFRNKWSTAVNNLMVDHEIDTIIDGGSAKRNNITLSDDEADIYNLEYMFIGNEAKGLTVNAKKGDKLNKYIELITIPTSSYYSSENLTDSIISNMVVNNVRFDGKIELIETKTENQMFQTNILARDNISDLLGVPINKNYIYSEEWVASTSSPFTDTMEAIGSWEANITNTMNSSTLIRYSGSLDTDLKMGDTLFLYVTGTLTDAGSALNKYVPIGVVAQDYSSGHSGNIQLINDCLVNLSKMGTTNETLRYRIVRGKKKLLAGKSMTNSYRGNDRHTDLYGAADKGIVFYGGDSTIEYTSTNEVPLVSLLANNNNYGLPIQNTLLIDGTGDNRKEPPLGFDFSYNLKSSLSNHGTMINVLTDSDNQTSLAIGYVSPIVLGRTANNSNDTIIDNLEGMYFVNTNGIDIGGFIHLLDSRNNDSTANYSAGSFRRSLVEDREENNTSVTVRNYNVNFGSSIYRYNALSKGNIKYYPNKSDIVSGETIDTAYINDYYSDKGGMYNAYAYGCKVAGIYKFSTDYHVGRTQTYLQESILSKRGPEPAIGSKYQDYTRYPLEWHNHLQNYSIRFPKPYSNTRNVDRDRNGERLLWDLNDPKVGNLYLFAPGDMVPTSERRFDDIGYGDKSIKDMHLLVKYKNAEKSLGITHENFIGDSVIENSFDTIYQILPILNEPAEDRKRFNILKLKTMTMDWLFNEVDFETYKMDNFGTGKQRVHKDKNARTKHVSEMFMPRSVTESGRGIAVASITSAIPSNGQNIAIDNAFVLSGNALYTSPFDDSTGQSRYIGTAPTLSKVTKTVSINHTSGLSDGSSTSVRHATMTSTSGLEVGMSIMHDDVATGVTITAINNGTTITLSADPISTSNTEGIFMPLKMTPTDFNTDVVGYSGEIYVIHHQNTNDEVAITTAEPSLGLDLKTLNLGSMASVDGFPHNYNIHKITHNNDLQFVYNSTAARKTKTYSFNAGHYMKVTVVANGASSTITVHNNGLPLHDGTRGSAPIGSYVDAIGSGSTLTLTDASDSNANGTYSITGAPTITGTPSSQYVISCNTSVSAGTYNLTAGLFTSNTFIPHAHCLYPRILWDCASVFENSYAVENDGTGSGWNTNAYQDLLTVTMKSHRELGSLIGMSAQQIYNRGIGFGTELQSLFKSGTSEVYPKNKVAIGGGFGTWLGNNQKTLGRVCWEMLFTPILTMAHINDGLGGSHNAANCRVFTDLQDSLGTFTDEGFLSFQTNIFGRDAGHHGNGGLGADGLPSYYSIAINDLSGGVGTIEWINYCPDLTGRFLVEETTNTIHQIISHSISKEGFWQHQLHLDNFTNFNASTGVYKVYNLSETCLNEDKQNYTLYESSAQNLIDPSTGTFHTGKSIDLETAPTIDTEHTITSFTTGTNAVDNSTISFTTQEPNVKAMYVIAELDGKGSKYLIHRDASVLFPTTAATGKFEVGSTNTVFITDGIDSLKTSLSIEEKYGTGTDASVKKIQLVFNDMKNLKGSPSIGTMFNVTVPKLRSRNIDYVKLVNPFNVLSEAEDIVNDILESNDIVYTKSGSTDKYYIGANFTGENAFTSANKILEFKKMHLNVNGEEIVVREDEEAKRYRTVEISQENDDTKITSINKNKSLLGKANEVIVYGDGIRSIARDNADIESKKKTSTKEIFEYSIASQRELDILAKNNLKIFNELGQAIDINVGQDLSLLEAGQIITVFYPDEGIPREPYTVIEIEREHGIPTKLILSKYNTDLSSTLSSLISVTSSLNNRTKDNTYTSLTVPNSSLHKLKVKFVKATVTSRTGSGTIGFVHTIGFDTGMLL